MLTTAVMSLMLGSSLAELTGQGSLYVFTDDGPLDRACLPRV